MRELKAPVNPTELNRFFSKLDWAGFCLTTVVMLAVYLFTLVPEVDLGFSGIFSTAAMHLGVPNPPGYPVWTVYAWFFVKLFPFFNIAWRTALATAMTGAAACGLIALLASRIGSTAAENFPRLKNLVPREQSALRVVSACVAGLGFGLDGCFWSKAVRPDPWPLAILLFLATLCFLTRWFFAPQAKRYLYFAALTYSLALGSGLSLVSAFFGLPFLIAFGDCKIGRNLFFGVGLVLAGVLFADHFFYLTGQLSSSVYRFLVLACGFMFLIWMMLCIKTRGCVSEWKAALLCGGLFFLGLGTCLVLPIISMTVPPVNWDYARSTEGFFRLIARGQYETIILTPAFSTFAGQCLIYGKIAANDFGLIYLIAAIVPFCVLRKIPLLTRKWLVGMCLLWVVSSFITLVALNPGADKSNVDGIKSYFAASHSFLALFAGIGLILIGAFFGRPAAVPSRA